MQSVAVEKDAQRVALVVPHEAPQRTRMPLFNGGESTEKSPDNLAENEVVQMEGLHIVAGKLVVDTGYVPFGGPYLGTAQGSVEVFFNDGTEVQLLFTTATVYRWNSAAAQWQVVSFNLTHLTTAPAAAGATTFSLDTVTDLTPGDVIGITLDDDTQLITTIVNIAVLDVTTTDPVPAGRSVGAGALVCGAPTLHGDPQVSQISTVLFAGNGWVVFSNGIDPVSYYLTNKVVHVPGLPTNTTCAALAVFHEMLLLLNTTENGVHRPWRVRASDAGDPTNWSTGIAAVYDLLDTEDAILAALLLGSWLILYRDSSIMRCSYLGILNEVLFFEYMSQLEGVQSQGAVVGVGGEHVFVGRSGIYSYQGGYNLDSIGDAVFNNFLAAQGDFNAPAKATLFTVYVPDLDEVWVIYPHARSAVPDKMLRVQLDNNSWSERVFADPMLAGALTLPLSETTWANAAGLWSDTAWSRPWDSQTLVQNVPSVLLCPAAVGGGATQTFLYDYRATTDAGAVVPWSVTSRQLGDGMHYIRWERVVVLAQGNGVLVEFSQDTGKTWQTLATLDFDEDDVSIGQTYIDTVSTRMQLRFSGTDPAFQLRYIDVFFELDSEW